MKILADRDAGSVDLAHPSPATVEALAGRAKPMWGNFAPRSPEERKVYTVTGQLVGFKLEEDQDWHIVIAGDSGQTMIVEIPSPDCDIGSKVVAQIAKARQDFERMLTGCSSTPFGATPVWRCTLSKKSTPVTSTLGLPRTL